MIKELKELRVELDEISKIIKGCHVNKDEVKQAYYNVIVAKNYLYLVMKEIDPEYSGPDESTIEIEPSLSYKDKLNCLIGDLDIILNSNIKYTLPEGLEPSRIIFFNQNYSRCLLEARFWLEEELKSVTA